MPTYLCHGFRWQRSQIRIFVIVEDIDEAAPDWVIGRGSSRALLERFAAKFDFVPRGGNREKGGGIEAEEKEKEKEKEKGENGGDGEQDKERGTMGEDSVLAHGWSAVKLLEEHDPSDTAAFTRPYAYVADHAVRVDLGADVGAEMRRYGELVAGADGAWIERLRDALQPGEGIGWYVVVCGDEERYAPPREEEDGEGGLEGEDEEDEEDKDKAEGAGGHSLRHRISSVGLRRLFIGKKKDSP